MLLTPRQQMLVDYLDATDNEIAVDQMLFGLAHTSPDRVGYFPRVSRWVGKAKAHPLLATLVWRMIWISWLCGGAMVFFLFEVLRLLISCRCSKKLLLKKIPLMDGAVLALSTRVCDVITPAIFPGLPKAWVTLPWAPQHRLPPDAKEFSLMNLVNWRDLFEAYLDAVYATYRMTKDSVRLNWVLQSYTAYRWFLVRRVVDQIAGTLVMAEHFDRWAVLVDRSVQLASKQSLSKRLVLIQHGSLGGLGGNSQEVKFMSLPARLTSVKELYVYSKQEEEVFLAMVLDGNGSACPLSVRYFKPNISLHGSVEAATKRVLFVGHPLCEKFHVSVFKLLHEMLEIEAFYKPHPKARMSSAMADVGWKIIDNVTLFPRVELLISYPSTLVIEYEGAGIQASIHALDMKSDSLDQFINQTLDMLVPKVGLVAASEFCE
jgi:hypothetical protein